VSDEFLAGHLAILAAVADHGGVTAAAGALNLTQPAVSNRLRTLEAFVGGALVARAGRRVVLTELGHELLPHARAIVRATARASAIKASLREAPHDVRVAISEAAIPLVMPRLTRCVGAAPMLNLQAVPCDASSAVRAVVGGDVDLAVSVAPPEAPADDLQRRSLLLDEIVLVRTGRVPAIVEIDAVRPLTVLWQARGSGVRATVERVLERAGRWPLGNIELGSSLGVLAAAAAGQGAAFLPRSYAAVWADAGRVRVSSIRTSDLFARFELICESPDQLAPGPRLVYDELLSSADHYG